MKNAFTTGLISPRAKAQIIDPKLLQRGTSSVSHRYFLSHYFSAQELTNVAGQTTACSSFPLRSRTKRPALLLAASTRGWPLGFELRRAQLHASRHCNSAVYYRRNYPRSMDDRHDTMGLSSPERGWRMGTAYLWHVHSVCVSAVLCYASHTRYECRTQSGCRCQMLYP